MGPAGKCQHSFTLSFLYKLLSYIDPCRTGQEDGVAVKKKLLEHLLPWDIVFITAVDGPQCGRKCVYIYELILEEAKPSETTCSIC